MTKKTDAKKLTTKAEKESGLTTMQIAMHNAGVTADSRQPPRIANPIDTIDKLRRISPFYGTRAHSNLCYTLGMFAINALGWKHFELTRAPVFNPSNAIDIFNDGCAKEADEVHEAAQTHAQGIASLPRVDGLLFCGAYKQMLAEIISYDKDEGTRLMPNLIFSRLQASRNDEATEAAYDDFTSTHANINEVRDMLKAEVERQRRRQAETTAKTAVAKLDYVLGELQSAKREAFSENVWASLPLFKQYQIARNVMSSVNSAAAAELRKPLDERKHEFDLIDMLGDLNLELKSVENDPEIKLAFEIGRLQPTDQQVEKQEAADPGKRVLRDGKVISDTTQTSLATH